jgi:lysophospholipase L1-like esterase
MNSMPVLPYYQQAFVAQGSRALRICRRTVESRLSAEGEAMPLVNSRPGTVWVLVIAIALSIASSPVASRTQGLPGTTPATIIMAAAEQAQFALKDGDRVVFYGDSITEQRLYTTYLEHYCTTHYPDRRITFINTGWGGDKVTGNDCQPCAGVGGLARIKRDLLDYQPTVVTLLFGMNDGQYVDFDPAILKVYQDGLRAIIEEIKSKTHARIYVMTPTVYDGTRHTPWSKTDKYNDVLDRYSDAAKQIAAAAGLPVIDLHTATTEALNRAKQKNPSYTFLPDGVHPAEDGQLLMAAEILRAWGAPANGRDLLASGGLSMPPGLSAPQVTVYTVTGPLPWPRPRPSETIAGVSPDITGIGNTAVHIRGLRRGKYSLTVDGKAAGDYTSEALAAGLDISRMSPTAIGESDKLAALIRSRADIFFFRWRQVQVPYDKDYNAAAHAASAMDKLIDEMRDRSRALGALHKYQLSITPAER